MTLFKVLSRAAVASVLSGLDNRRANAFDQIPASQHAAILAGTSTYDASSDLNTLLAQSPGVLQLPKGVIGVAAPVLLATAGTRIVGTTAGYATPLLPGSTTLKALSGFSGAAVVDVGSAGDDVSIRAVGVQDVEINLAAVSTGTIGLRVNKPYDNCVLERVAVLQGCDDAYNFYLAGTSAQIGQTLACRQLFGTKANNTATVGVFYIRRLQECQFDLCKGFGVSPGSVSANNIYDIEDCTGLLLNDCSAAFTSGYAFNILSRRIECWGITLLDPTLESVAKDIKVNSVAFKLFGSGLTTTTVGTVVKQPANGSTATGTCLLSTSTGVYVSTLTGAFATGLVYDTGGSSLGTITSITPFYNRNVRVINPRQIGQSSITPAASSLAYLDSAQVEWKTTTSGQTISHDTTVTNSRIDALDRTKVTGFSPSVAVRASADLVTLYQTDVATNPYTLPTPAKGLRLRLVKDDTETNSGLWRLVAPGSVAFGYNRSGYGTTDTQLLLSGQWSEVTLYGVDANTWQVEHGYGVCYGNNRGRIFDRPLPMVLTTSQTFGSQHSGAEVRNTGASGIVVVTLPAIAGPGITCNIGCEYTILRDSAAQALRLAPNSADQIQGASAINKYLSVDSDAGFAKIKALRANFWALIASGGTISYAA